jgi:ATP-dependent protease ClpP protease subunit
MTTETETTQTHSQALQENGMYVFMGEVNDENICPIVEWILHENFVVKKKRKELLLMICSEGGDMGAAFALIDVMRSSVIPIKTVGLGMIASAGLLIFISGTPGRRVLTPNTSILSHQFSPGAMKARHMNCLPPCASLNSHNNACQLTINCVQGYQKKRFESTCCHHMTFG